MVTHFKKIYEEHTEKYIGSLIAYNYPYLKEGDVNKAYQKAFGSKTIGSNFEKLAKRMCKHLNKEYYLFG